MSIVIKNKKRYNGGGGYGSWGNLPGQSKSTSQSSNRQPGIEQSNKRSSNTTSGGGLEVTVDVPYTQTSGYSSLGQQMSANKQFGKANISNINTSVNSNDNKNNNSNASASTNTTKKKTIKELNTADLFDGDRDYYTLEYIKNLPKTSRSGFNLQDQNTLKVMKKVNQLLNLNKSWNHYDALNYLEGKGNKYGLGDNLPRYNNGELKYSEGLAIGSDKIKGDTDWRTFGNFLRSKKDVSPGINMFRDDRWTRDDNGQFQNDADGNPMNEMTWSQQLDLSAGNFEPGSPAWNAQRALLDEKRKYYQTNGNIFEAFMPGGMIFKAIIGETGGKARMKDPFYDQFNPEIVRFGVPISQTHPWSETYDAGQRAEKIRELEEEYFETGEHYSPDNEKREALIRNQLQDLIPTGELGDLESIDGATVFNNPITDQQLKFSEVNDNDEDVSSDYTQAVGDTEEDEDEPDTTIELADPYLGLPWWKDRGGFEKLFGLPLPYGPYKTGTSYEGVALKEGGIIGYQAGGSVRPPQMIQDPNAAPAAMRADDVNLQAETGDFIMGYPAMQQSGTRVRSLVEQAMLKAKDAGVKTKGYKHGDKVDILVHNGEMHIPKELVPYIEGGYTTLKKFNQPSKYYTGDIVLDNEGFIDRYQQIPEEEKIPSLEKLNSDIKTMTGMQKTEQNYDTWFNSLTFQEKQKVHEKMTDKWIEEFRKKQKNVFFRDGYKFTEHQELKKIYNRLYNSIDGELKDSLEDEETKHNLVKISFENIHQGLQMNEKSKNLSLTRTKLKKKKFFKNILNTTWINDSLQRFLQMYNKPTVTPQVELTGNGIKYNFKPKVQIFSQNIPLQEDTTLKDFIKRNEGNKGLRQIVKDPGNDNYTVGYGSTIKNKQRKDYLNRFRRGLVMEEPEADALLDEDLKEAEHTARLAYNKFVKGGMYEGLEGFNTLKTKQFDKLQPNEKIMLTEIAFNMGTSVNQFKNFMTAMANSDYKGMAALNHKTGQPEYHRKETDKSGKYLPGLHTRNNDFYKTFIAPNLDKSNL